MSVLYSIGRGVSVFAELKRIHPNLSDQVLAARLRELLREGLIIKYEQPDQRRYEVTARGESLLQIIRALCDWIAQDA
jgi:DNA-binding HxlR family transcriptional regulator